MPHKDPEKRRKYWREWYHNNPDKVKEYYRKKARRRRKQTKQWYHSYKETLSCERCEEDNSCCLEFHHTDPSKKDFNLSLMRAGGYSKKRILEEINKCVVLCANCHRKEHAKIRNNKKHEKHSNA